MMTKYTRSVDAALSETASKFALAEALALDIPRKQGQGGLMDDIDGVRKEIIEAGGEPRAAATLRDYRATALWAELSSGTTTKFGWVNGYSFTAHREAMGQGTSIEEFNANPKTARETRIENGNGSKDGDPTNVIAGWSPEQKRQAQDALYQDAIESERRETANRTRATATPEEKAKPEPKRGTEAGEAKAAIEGAMAEVMHFSRDTIRRSEAATQRFEAAMPNQWWNRAVPGSTAYRSHEEQVLGDIDKAIEALSLMRIKVAKAIDKAQATV